MICLAVNTATTILSVALVRDATVLRHYASPETRDQGNLLLRHAQNALTAENLSFKDIDLLAVATGPGSFTGIRIGLAAMRGIALAANKPITGISTFDLFSVGQNKEDNIVAVESWRDELYFRIGNSEPVNLTPEDFAAALDKDRSYIISGDAAEKMAPYLSQATIERGLPDAVKLAQMAVAQKGAYTAAEPFYLRPADVSLSSNPIRNIAQ